MTTTYATELPGLPRLPPDRSYAADLQLGTELVGYGRVTLLRQLASGHVQLATDARHDPDTWEVPADHVYDIRVAEHTPTRSAIAALQVLTDDVAAMAAAEAELRAAEQVALGHPPYPTRRTDQPQPQQLPAGGNHPNASATYSTADLIAAGGYVQVSTPNGPSTYHLLPSVDTLDTVQDTAAALCGTTRNRLGAKGWQAPDGIAAHCCRKCADALHAAAEVAQ